MQLILIALCLLLIVAAIFWVIRSAVARMRTEQQRLHHQHQKLQNQMMSLQEERHAMLSHIRLQEQAIHRIANGYGLSKQLLGTLDLEEALRLTQETFSEEGLPFFTAGDESFKKIRDLVARGTVTREAIQESFPATKLSREQADRFKQLTGQLYLGYRRIALYGQVQELAFHDGLTGLFSRRHFMQRLAEELERSARHRKPLAFLMIDLDHFKVINDTHGHLVGDVVLKEVAHLVRRSVREIDVVGRYGGEEFAVAMPEAGHETALGVAQRIRELVEKTSIAAYDEQVHVTVSVGVAVFPTDADSSNELVEKADAAMYRAKSAGRNQVKG